MYILLTRIFTFKEVSGLGALATDTANGSGGGSSAEIERGGREIRVTGGRENMLVIEYVIKHDVYRHLIAKNYIYMPFNHGPKAILTKTPKSFQGKDIPEEEETQTSDSNLHFCLTLITAVVIRVDSNI